MDNRKDELERFKSEINLSEYAANLGYAIDKSESSRRSIVMRRDGDKITIGRDTDNHYIYYSFRDALDNGTILDFLDSRGITNLGHKRRELRPWISSDFESKSDIKYYEKNILTSEKDRQGILIEHAKQITIKEENKYLTQVREIPSSIYLSKRFKGRIYTDKYKNAVFPHYDEKGLCGFEKKNNNFTGFSKGGIKTIWLSNCFKDDKKLVIVESAIEALSYETINKDKTSRYISMGGNWSEGTLIILNKIIDNFNGEIVLAFNNDKAGHELTEKLKEQINRKENINIHYPVNQDDDWNEQLKTQ